MSSRDKIIVLHDTKTNRIHFTAQPLAGDDNNLWLDVTDSVFATIERHMVKAGIANNVTLLTSLRQCGACCDLEVLFNKAA